MTTAVLNYLKSHKKVQAKVQAIDIDVDMSQVNWKIVCFSAFFMILALVIFYAWQVNELTRGYYTINSYEDQLAQLLDENKTLQISFAENSFLGQVQEQAKSLNFQKTTSVKYIHVPDKAVAVNVQ